MGTIRIDAKQLLDNLERAETKSQIAIKMFATEGAKKFQNYAKTHKRWTNRTGHAVQRLTGFVETNQDNTKIYISHGVDYGKLLELAHEKRYEIFEKTVQNVSPEILFGFTELLKHLR